MLGGSVFDEDPGEYIAFIIDLTESKKTEARLEMSLEATESGAWDWNIGTGEVLFDRNWLSMTGYTAEEIEPHISFWEALVHPEDLPGFKDAVDSHFKESAHYYEYEYRLKTKSGRYIWSYNRGKVIERDEKNNPLRMIGLDTNITQRRQHEEQIRRAQKMDALGKLTGGIAHDFNNILGIIGGYSELLASALNEEPKLARFAQQINHASERGVKITRKLLSFSRVKDNSPQNLDINVLLRDQQDMLKKTLTVRIKLNFDFYDDLWPVWLDSADLEDAIINLSINAMHAINQSGNFDIKTRNEHLSINKAKNLSIEPKDYVVLSFADTGVGMDKETKDKIFEPFFSTKGEMGTGLGLSQVYGFVKRSFGAIKVSSDIGRGSCFELYFPRYIENNKVDTPEGEASLEYFEGSESLLVVDDEPELLNLTQEILQNQGYKVSCALCGKEALDILKSKEIDLMISDILMPEQDGYELAAIVKELYPSIIIQLVSGYSGDKEAGNVKNDMQANLLHKPVEAKELLLRVRSLLNKK